jgi:hypothetical protein
MAGEIPSAWLVAPPLQAGVVGTFPSMGCMVSQPFAVGGNRSYPEFWVITGSLRYPGSITLTQLTVSNLLK